MNTEHERSPDAKEPQNHLRDRSDWISKYLDLADKMIETHMPNRAGQPDRR